MAYLCLPSSGIKAVQEEMKKTQTEVILEMEILSKRTETTDASITNRIQEIEKRISGIKDRIVEINTLVKESIKSKMFLTQNIQEIWDTIKRSNLRIIGIEEGNIQLKSPENIFNKITEENFLGWRDGSMVKSTDCSSEGPEFKSQQPHGGSQPISNEI
jgi:restriction endonuclease